MALNAVATKEDSDEDLVVCAQNGDDDAFTELYTRYKTFLVQRVTNLSRRVYTIHRDDWSSYMDEYFLEAVRKFNVNCGVPFLYYVSRKLSHRARDVVRCRLAGELPNIEPLTDDIIDSTPDPVNSADVPLDEESTDLYRHITSQSTLFSRLMRLKLSGLSDFEIGMRLGFDGNRHAIEERVRRIINKIRKLTDAYLSS